MTIPAGLHPPTLEELRARPVGRTGAELVVALREGLLLVTWDEGGGVFRVTDTEDRLRMILGTAGPVHSTVVFLALATAKRWEPPAPRRSGRGHTTWRVERLPTGQEIHAVPANDWPIAIGQGPTEAAAFAGLARIREAVGG